MRVNYKIEFEVDTDDYVETLGEINGILQDNLEGDPQVVHVIVRLPRELGG